MDTEKGKYSWQHKVSNHSYAKEHLGEGEAVTEHSHAHCLYSAVDPFLDRGQNNYMGST